MKMETKQNQSVDGGGAIVHTNSRGFLYLIPTMCKIFCRCFFYSPNVTKLLRIQD